MKYLSLRKLNIFRRPSEKFKKSLVNLLIDEEIPIKNTPPKSETTEIYQIPYFSSKRLRTYDSLENIQPILKIRKKELPPRPKIVRTINFNVNIQGELGLTIERDQNSVNSKYFISRINSNKPALNDHDHHRQLWLGDEVVKISKQRIRGVTENQLKQTIENCLGNVELMISRDSKFSFKGNLLYDWPKQLKPRTMDDDSEIWNKLHDQSENVNVKMASKKCEIVGYLRKNGSCEEIEDEKIENVTGMKKFFLKKPPVNLTQDLIIIQFEMALVKKLGFSIVGGSDSKINGLGIFIKNIFPDGQAKEKGMKIGDEIFIVNEIIVKGKSHAKALQIIQEAKNKPMTLKIKRGLKVKF